MRRHKNSLRLFTIILVMAFALDRPEPPNTKGRCLRRCQRASRRHQSLYPPGSKLRFECFAPTEKPARSHKRATRRGRSSQAEHECRQHDRSLERFRRLAGCPDGLRQYALTAALLKRPAAHFSPRTRPSSASRNVADLRLVSTAPLSAAISCAFSRPSAALMSSTAASVSSSTPTIRSSWRAARTFAT